MSGIKSKTLEMDEEHAERVAGLRAGDRVVSVGQNKLYRGARVVLEGGAGPGA